MPKSKKNNRNNNVRNNKKKNNNNNKVKNTVNQAMPYRVSSTTKSVVPTTTTTGKMTRITNREIWREVSTDASGLAISGGPINPGRASFRFLGGIAKSWDEYKFNKLRFSFQPCVPYTVTGTVGMAFDPDVTDPGPEDLSELSVMKNAVVTQAFAKATTDAPSEFITDRKRFVREGGVPSGSDPKSYDVGYLWFVANTDSISKPLGVIYIDYDVELFGPQAPGGLTDVISDVIDNKGATHAMPLELIGLLPYEGDNKNTEFTRVDRDTGIPSPSGNAVRCEKSGFVSMDVQLEAMKITPPAANGGGFFKFIKKVGGALVTLAKGVVQVASGVVATGAAVAAVEEGDILAIEALPQSIQEMRAGILTICHVGRKNTLADKDAFEVSNDLLNEDPSDPSLQPTTPWNPWGSSHQDTNAAGLLPGGAGVGNLWGTDATRAVADRFLAIERTDVAGLADPLGLYFRVPNHNPFVLLSRVTGAGLNNFVLYDSAGNVVPALISICDVAMTSGWYATIVNPDHHTSDRVFQLTVLGGAVTTVSTHFISAFDADTWVPAW